MLRGVATGKRREEFDVTVGGAARARSLLESGRYKEAGELFVAAGELASAARSFVGAKDYFRAAVCYEKARKPLDAARLYQQIRHWSKAAELYAVAGDTLRAEFAREQLEKEQEGLGHSRTPATAWAHTPLSTAASHAAPAAAAPSPASQRGPEVTWPTGELWRAIRDGDTGAAVERYLHGGRSGWELIAEAGSGEVLKALAETLLQARDHAVAAEAFHKAGELLRSAQCLSLAGVNEEAAHLFYNLGQKALAAQHFEKAQAWEQAAAVYLQESLFLDAARCHEKDDDPVRAAAMYLKARKLDLALPLLQSVPPTHRGYAACRLLAGKILFQKGQKELAVSLLSPLLESPPRTEEDLESYYQAATLMEMGGATERARDAYLLLQETRFGYKDVTERLQRGPSAEPPGAPLAAPAPSEGAAPPPAMDLAPLRDCSLFNRLGNEELRRLWTIGRTGECKPGKVILKAGEVAAGLMVVLSGGITITPDPANPIMASGFLGPGDYVGLGSLFNGPPLANALVAQKGTRLLVLPPEPLEALLTAEPELGARFYRSVAEHLVQTLMAGKSSPTRT